MIFSLKFFCLHLVTFYFVQHHLSQENHLEQRCPLNCLKVMSWNQRADYHHAQGINLTSKIVGESIAFLASVVYHTLVKQNVVCFHLNEHKLSIQNQETNKSAIAKHSWESDHTFNFHSAKIICKPSSVFELDFLETFHIHKNHNNVVKCDFPIPSLLDCWKSYIKSNFS